MPNYIIDNANIVKQDHLLQKSFLIKDNEIYYIADRLPKDKAIRMNVSHYKMTPGLVMVDYDYENRSNFQEFKKHQQQLIEKGCTTIILPCKVRYEKEIAYKLKEARHFMINSSIDFSIGIYLPISAITPSVIRLCKREKIPFILTDIDKDMDIFNSVPWGWIRESMYSYNIPIYPVWRERESKLIEQLSSSWNEIMKNHYIETSTTFPENFTPVSKEILMQTGIYPSKGELLIGGDVDYNFYALNKKQLVDDSINIDYDRDNPLVTVHKGKVLKADSCISFYPGFGREVAVDRPGKFKSK